MLGQARADELLIQLPLFVTMNGGATPVLQLPGGTVLGDGAQVAAFLLGMEGRAGRLDQRTIGIYNEVASWLDQVGQQLLQLAWTMSQLSQGETNGNRQVIDTEVAKLAEALAAVPAALRGQAVAAGQFKERLHLTGHQADLSLVIDPVTGEWTYRVHDIAGSTDWFKIVVEAVGLIATAVLVVASGGGATPLVFVEAGALTGAGVAGAVVVTTSLIEAGESFANGDVLGGLLSIASAVGVSFQGNLLQLGNPAQAAKIGGLILAARGIIGGVASAVQSAEAGNTLGLVSSILSVAASAAAGDVALQTDTSAEAIAALKAGTPLPGSGPSEALKDVGLFLTGLSTATSIADAYNRGDIQGGLMASLNGVLTAYSIISQTANVNGSQSEIAPGGGGYVEAQGSADEPEPPPNDPGAYRRQAGESDEDWFKRLSNRSQEAANFYKYYREAAVASLRAINSAINADPRFALTQFAASQGLTLDAFFNPQKYGTPYLDQTVSPNYSVPNDPLSRLKFFVPSDMGLRMSADGTIYDFSRILPQVTDDGSANGGIRALYVNNNDALTRYLSANGNIPDDVFWSAMAGGILGSGPAGVGGFSRPVDLKLTSTALSRLGVSGADQARFLQGEIVPFSYPTSGQNAVGFVQLSAGKLTTQLLSLNSPDGGGTAAMLQYLNTSRALGVAVGVSEVELQGAAVINPDLASGLVKRGFVPKQVVVPAELGGGTMEVLSKTISTER